MEVEIKELASRPLIGIRGSVSKSEIGDFIPNTFAKVGPYFQENGMSMTGPPVAIYYGEHGNKMDMAAGAPVTEVTITTEEITVLELPGGKVATAIYEGPYEGIPAAWEQFAEEIMGQGLTTAEPYWEEYLTSPETEPDSSKWQTLMVQPIVD
jgi:effector-binding domain-containing protein